jgi:hypothetical protein
MRMQGHKLMNVGLSLITVKCQAVRCVEFVRVVASLIPRELEATITPVTERMSNAQLEAIIARGIEGGLDPAVTDEDARIIQ